ncbi:selenocysteine-specific translation elongation factor [Clostridium sp. 'deep sea']|uniref:selenocysteine-specific translation elongation factor n=1 Tax=Clostridium sp. 'deep sea' TaxID=2779445 RepID=UPI0018964211|nr:selenocysteine-specific translation elongation factor [Clostridium sp. 'deep sea']QOR33710.1 selenocysteine-specific translation elongation factor [Clostridium sp. 'deep sea']
MKHVIVGTAGHVDHGKSTLIRSLTGIDPDRLKEEKQRGLTIDIGFAWFDLPSGKRAGIVDVPGHEKFIKNMLAGAIGFDVVLLVVAADEGIMPQTKEHLNILSLLNIKSGMVALTKIDMVDEEWRELVIEEIREQLKDTFLAESPIVQVSAPQSLGLDELVKQIDILTEQSIARDTECDFRMPIDRSFPIKGFGTVVTGTLMEGSIKVGDSAELQPLSKKTRIRNIQIHGKKAEEAFAGQRVALNLADVTVEECQRGQVLAPQKLLRATMMLDVMLKLLPDNSRPLKHWDRVRFYTGTSEVLGRVVLFERDEMWPGEELPVQIRLEQTLVTMRDDRFVIRSYSPLETIGGGYIIDANPTKKRRFRSGVLDDLNLKATGQSADIIINSLKKENQLIFEREAAIRNTGLRDAAEAINELIEAEEIIPISIDSINYLVLSTKLDSVRAEIIKFLSTYHKKYPLREGAARAEIRSRFLTKASAKLYQQLIILLSETGEIYDTGDFVKLNNFKVEYTGKYLRWYENVIKKLQEGQFAPLGVNEMSEELAVKVDELKEILNNMLRNNQAIKLTENIYLLQTNYEKALKILVAYFEEHDSIDLATYRNLLNTSRKYALPLLETFDQSRITKREGNVRKLIR